MYVLRQQNLQPFLLRPREVDHTATRRGQGVLCKKIPRDEIPGLLPGLLQHIRTLGGLKRKYEEALAVDDVVGLVIGTRPDCVSDEALDYLQQLNQRTFLIVEYGIESANDNTLRRINRGHTFDCSRQAIIKAHQRGIITCGHIILGLPGEDEEEMLHQASTISQLPLDILKLHQLQIIKGTPLAKEYEAHPFHVFSAEEYVNLVIRYVSQLRNDLVLERFVSQSPPNMVIAPKWGLKNHEFTDLLNKRIRELGYDHR